VSTSRTVPQVKARAHEALVPRLEALLKQIQAMAARRPDGAVPAESRALAEALLFDAQPFAGGRKRGAMPAVSETLAGLAAELGQAQAALKTFEAAHTTWNAVQGCFAWNIDGRGKLPVQRLRPQLKAVVQTEREKKDLAYTRIKVLKRFDEHHYDGYRLGYADGVAGLPEKVSDELNPRAKW
jgi:hypothetical protein